MRRAALASLAVLAFAPATAAAHTAATPHLRLALGSNKIVVTGASFRRLERVRVTVATSSMQAKATRASAAGGFTLSFDLGAADRCSGVFVRAVGSRGSSVAAKIPPRECITQRSP